MAKTINVPGSSVPLYDHGTYWSPVSTIAPVQVGSVSALSAAVSGAIPGTIIDIMPGTYNLTDTLVVNTPSVTIRSYTGNRADVVLVGRGMDNSSYGGAPHGIWTNAANLSIKNLTIRDFWQHGVTFGAGANSPIISNVAFYDLGQQMVKSSMFPYRVDNGIIEDCHFEYTNGTPTVNHGSGTGYIGAVDVHNGYGWIVRRNFFKNQHTPDGSTYLWSPAVLFWDRSANTIVEENRFLNCDRAIALGLTQRTDGTFDHQGGIVRNNMSATDAGLFSAARIASSDAPIIVWQSPGTKIYHNTVLARGNYADALQFRWETQGAEASNNLLDDSIRVRNSAVYTGTGNLQNASASYFVAPADANLRIAAGQQSNIPTVTRLADAQYDIDGDARPVTTYIGAHHYG